MYCKSIIFLLFTYSSISFSYGQINSTRSWYFGQGLGLRFESDTLQVKTGYIGNTQYEGTGVYNSKKGQLLYYVNLGHLYDSNNNQFNFNYELGGGSSASQANILTSINDSLLHIFGTTSGYDFIYSTFDIKANKFEILGKSLIYRASEAEALVNHQNGRWQWVVSHSRLGDTLFSYLITDDGLETCPVVSHAGPFYDDWYPGQGVLKFSEDGKFVFIGAWSLGKVTVCDFNNQTGAIIEKFRISITDTFPYGIEIIKDKLFVSCNRPNDIILQYSLNKLNYVDVMNSRKLLFDTSELDIVGQLQRAIDGNIYVAMVNQSRLAFLNCKNNFKFTYTKNLFGTKKCYGGFPNFNASYFYTPALNFTYTRNCETNTFKFTAADTFGANNWQWHFTKGNIIKTKSGKLITHTFSETGHWQVRCIAGNGSRNDTIFKTIEIQKPLQRQYLSEDILFAAGANISGNLSINNFQNPHCVHWQKLGDTIEKLGNTYTYNDTGIFVCKATNKVFCTYLDTIKVRVCDSFARAAIIKRSGDSLFTNTYAAKYQWFVNDTAIQNGTKPALKLVRIGKYKLRTWNIAGCDSFSTTFNINSLGISYLNVNDFNIYPNPNSGTFFIKSKNSFINTIEIFDHTGKKVISKRITTSNIVEMNIELRSGFYLVRINENKFQTLMVRL